MSAYLSTRFETPTTFGVNLAGFPSLSGANGTIGQIDPGTRGAVVNDTGGTFGIIQSLISDGLGAYKTYTAADIASQQIKAGQYPSVIGQNGQLSGTANVSPLSFNASGSSSWILLAAVAVVVVMVVLKS